MTEPADTSVASGVLAPDHLGDTSRWLERAVIGLNLCPFAKAVVAKGQVRMVLSEARDAAGLLETLGVELLHLRDTPADVTDTTLIVHPHVLGDFLDYNDFLENADALVGELDLEGMLQVASFHPRYQFAGSAPDDIANATNRSPWPTLHLLLHVHRLGERAQVQPDHRPLHPSAGGVDGIGHSVGGGRISHGSCRTAAAARIPSSSAAR